MAVISELWTKHIVDKLNAGNSVKKTNDVAFIPKQELIFLISSLLKFRGKKTYFAV